MSRQQKWPEEVEQTVRSMWAGNTALVIAQELKARHGMCVSRESVIGKAHRLGLRKQTHKLPNEIELTRKKLERSNGLFLIAAAKEVRQ